MATSIYGVQQVTELLPNFYLTSIYGATKENIMRRNVTLLINAAQELPKAELNNVEVIKLFLDDTPYALISVYFDRIADKINDHLSNGGRVMIHCVLGVSRSTSLCLAYLMKHRNMSLKQAFDYVSSRRPCARPNPGFWRQLIEYEKRLNQKPILTSKQGSTSIPITIVSSNDNSNINNGNNNNSSSSNGTSFTRGNSFYNSNGNPVTLLKPPVSMASNGWLSNENINVIAQPSKLHKINVARQSARNSARQSTRSNNGSSMTINLTPRNENGINNAIYKSIQIDNMGAIPSTAAYQVPPTAPPSYTNHRTTLLINNNYPINNNNNNNSISTANEIFVPNRPHFTTTYRSSYGTTSKY